jgi:hypothetical protein
MGYNNRIKIKKCKGQKTDEELPKVEIIKFLRDNQSGKTQH